MAQFSRQMHQTLFGLGPHRMMGVGGHVGEQLVETVKHFVGDPVIQAGPAHYRIGAVRDDIPDHHLIGVQRSVGPADGGIDQRAMAIFRHHHFQNLSEGCCDVEIDGLLFYGALEHGSEAILVQRRNGVAQQSGSTEFDPAFAAAWRLQEASDATGQIDMPHTLGNQPGDQEIVLQETGQRIADPVLVARYDRGMGDRQTHGVTK